MTPRLWGERGRRRAIKLGIDPARLPPGQSPTTKFPVLTVGPNANVPTDRWLLSVHGEADAMVHSDGGYTTNVPLEALLDDDVLVAHGFDGAPRPTACGRVCPQPDHGGGPARLLVPPYTARGVRRSARDR